MTVVLVTLAVATPTGWCDCPPERLLRFWPAVPIVLSQLSVLVAVLALLVRARSQKERQAGEASASS